ncbi:MAG: peptidylprolyl isomerase, partial [Myxococcota bacterium]
GDPIVRRRVVSKVRQAARQIPDPDEQAIGRWFAKNAETFARPARFSIEQRFYGEGSQGRQAAEQALNAPKIPPGLPLPFGAKLAEAPASRIAAWLSPAAADLAKNATVAEWFGPIQSKFGWHISRVTRRIERRIPPLTQIHTQVARAYRQQAEDRAERQAIARILSKIDIDIQWPAPLLAAVEAAP